MKDSNPKVKEEVRVPVDVRKVLTLTPKTIALWESLTPLARRDFILWIDQAKLPETRKRRIDSLPSRLASGKRRPCCYALVPMNLYKALGMIPKAKATWSNLTPLERRAFTGWIQEAKDTDTRTDRINKACSLLSSGKRHP